MITGARTVLAFGVKLTTDEIWHRATEIFGVDLGDNSAFWDDLHKRERPQGYYAIDLDPDDSEEGWLLVLTRGYDLSTEDTAIVDEVAPLVDQTALFWEVTGEVGAKLKTLGKKPCWLLASFVSM